ncbi:hypothetical protein [Streptomyces spirodelae]|uniref:Uncharacterized protein n=1 Tax=Streptomyces spirodelae TaxID=2812904 RepID=A0ABS3X1K0_9ACTN|nr:hypothetical protein [Streptomyces spirodelae]MBO8189253.1 hypothetical protein [Streptomyces spirodelae]
MHVMVFAWLRDAFSSRFRRKASSSLDTYEADTFSPGDVANGPTIADWHDVPSVRLVRLKHVHDWIASQPRSAAVREFTIDTSAIWKHLSAREPSLSSDNEQRLRLLWLMSAFLEHSDSQAIFKAAHTWNEALLVADDEEDPLPQISEKEAAAVGSEAGKSLEYALARLFLRLGPPPEPTAVEYAPASSGGGGTQQ